MSERTKYFDERTALIAKQAAEIEKLREALKLTAVMLGIAIDRLELIDPNWNHTDPANEAWNAAHGALLEERERDE